MIKNFILTSLRSMLRHKGFSFINIVGLAIGLAACIIIMLFIVDELSYDRFHEKSDRIYRITVIGAFGDNDFAMTHTPAPLAKTFLDEFPEVEHVTRLMGASNRLISYEEKSFIEERFFFADSSVFDVFTIPFIAGDPKTALNRPKTIVITETMAKKYFGDEDPIGKTLRVDDNAQNYLVTGVCQDLPHNSHFRFDFLASIITTEWSRSQSWFMQNGQTYLALRENADPADLEAKFPDMLERHLGPQLQQFLGVSIQEFEDSGQSYGYYLQAITDIHLHSRLDGEFETNSDISYVYLFSVIAIFILLIACINFMNLTTAKSALRAKEVGVRKVLGSQRGTLIRQFLGESLVYSILAMIFALIIAEIALPFFNQLTGKYLTLNLTGNWYYLPVFVVFILITSLLAGSYPAFYLSAFQPLHVLKGQKVRQNGKSGLRTLLVLFQFSISIILLIATFVVYQQLKFIQDKNLGFDKEHLLVIKRAYALGDQKVSFKNELLQNPNILRASYTIDLPGEGFGSTTHGLEGRPNEEFFMVIMMYGDYDMAKTLGLEMAYGRYYDKEYATDTAAVVINQAAARAFGISEPYNERIIRQALPPNPHQAFRIIGVVEDFHFESLHLNVRPLAIYLRPEREWFNRMAIRIRGDEMAATIQFVENKWNETVHGQPFEYSFMDNTLEKLYRNDNRTRIIYSVFSILAVFVASLGLLGLAAFTTENRTKEIGIRKAHGASVGSIVMMLSKEFTRWVLLANIIAWPVAYFLMDNWLHNFAFRINMPLFSFVAAGLLALVIAIITVSSLAYKAANANPVEALKYE
jgi:putative ABC transport system permease protein